MNYYSTQITNLIEELRRLPGIGSSQHSVSLFTS